MSDLKDVRQADAYKSKFLKGSALSQRPVTYTIQSARFERLEQQDQEKLIISFSETDQQLVCNKSQVESLADMFGPDASVWTDKRCDLMARKLTNGQFAGKFTIDILPIEAPAEEDPFPDKSDSPADQDGQS